MSASSELPPTERTGTTGVAPAPGERRLRCWIEDCKAWFTLPPVPPSCSVIGTWPQYADTGIFVPLTLCAECAERHYQQRVKERQDGCHKSM